MVMSYMRWLFNRIKQDKYRKGEVVTMKDINVSDNFMPPYLQTYSDAAGQGVWSECSGDFTLPEYMPEIAKMIKTEGRVIPSGKYIGAERAEFSGNVVYSILYAGEDGIPYYTTLGCEYEYAVPLGAALGCSDIEIYDETYIESTSVRPSGPRKLSVKSKIKAVPHIIYKKEDDLSLSVPSGDDVYQKLCKKEKTASIAHFESGEFELEESLRIDGASPDSEIVGCVGNVCITDVRPTQDAIVCRGECECRIYYYDILAGRRTFLSTQKKLHFEKDIPSYRFCDIQSARANGKVISSDVSTDEESNELSISLTLNIWGEYVCECEKEYIKDIYACGYECNAEYKNDELVRAVLCKNSNFSLHAQKKLENEAVGDVCAVFASPRIDAVNIDQGTATVTGDISVDVLMRSPSDGEFEYMPENMTVPFKCDIPTLCSASQYDIRISPEVSGVKIRVERESMSADAELYLSILIRGCDSIRALRCAETLEDIKQSDGCCIRIYYPDKDESLWSIGKKYSASVDTLARINGLDPQMPDSPESLMGVRSLIIK